MAKLSRAFRIVAGYIAASVVAGVVALIGLLFATAGPFLITPSTLLDLLAPIIFASVVAGATAFLPTLPVGIYAERHAKRALAWYTRAGVGIGLAALVLYVLASEVASRSVSNAGADDAKFLLTLAVSVMFAGVCSGATYWAIAGRHAGGSGVATPASPDTQQT